MVWEGRWDTRGRDDSLLLKYQHDGARPHVSKGNQQPRASEGKKKGFIIKVVTQPAQSSDLNVNDLAFFASLQGDTELVANNNMCDLQSAVVIMGTVPC